MHDEDVSTALKTYLPLANSFLRQDLDLPPRLVASSHHLRVYIDGAWRLSFRVFDDHVWPGDDPSGSLAAHASEEGACYAPGQQDRLMLVPDLIDADARAAGIDPAVLAEILLAHECVHAKMMGHLSSTVPGPARDWIQGDATRFIHEAAALRFCAALPGLTGNRIAKADIAAYFDYVRRQAEGSAAGRAYSRYFDEFADTPDSALWGKLTAGIALVDELARGPKPQ